MSEARQRAVPGPANRYELFLWSTMGLQYAALAALVVCILLWPGFRFFAASVVAWFGAFVAAWHAREIWVEAGFREKTGPAPDPTEDLFPNR